MSPLEQRYRALLRWLPEPARSRWADDMTETFLAVATADDPEYAEFGSPSPRDRIDVARLALRLRLGAPGASVRAVAAGRVVRLVALAGTVALASSALVGLVVTAWVHGRLPAVPALDLPDAVPFGPREALTACVDLLTVVLAICVVRGLAAARPLAVVVLAGSAALTPGLPAGFRLLDLLPLLTVSVPLVSVALVPAEPARRGTGWPVALAALPVATFGSWLWAQAAAPVQAPVWWAVTAADPAVQWAVAVAVAGLGTLIRRPAGGAPALAVAVLGAALLPLLVSRLPFYTDAVPGYTATMVAAVVATAAVTALAAVIGRRALRTLPADAVGEPGGS